MLGRGSLPCFGRIENDLVINQMEANAISFMSSVDVSTYGTFSTTKSTLLTSPYGGTVLAGVEADLVKSGAETSGASTTYLTCVAVIAAIMSTRVKPSAQIWSA